MDTANDTDTVSNKKIISKTILETNRYLHSRLQQYATRLTTPRTRFSRAGNRGFPARPETHTKNKTKNARNMHRVGTATARFRCWEYSSVPVRNVCVCMCVCCVCGQLTRMPSSRDMARRGRSARSVRIVLKAGILPNPAAPTNRLKMPTLCAFFVCLFVCLRLGLLKIILDIFSKFGLIDFR